MQFLHFISAIVVIYLIYYFVVYFLEASKLKKATVNTNGTNTVYAVQVEKQQPLTVAGKAEIEDAEVIETQEQGDNEKKN